jgi:hypothetical protein
MTNRDLRIFPRVSSIFSDAILAADRQIGRVLSRDISAQDCRTIKGRGPKAHRSPTVGRLPRSTGFQRRICGLSLTSNRACRTYPGYDDPDPPLPTLISR